MSGHIAYALGRINRAIPKQLLHEAYGKQDIGGMLNPFGGIINPNELIRDKVITGRVLADLNIVGGIETEIASEKCMINRQSDNSYIIVIPKEATNGKSVTSLLGLRLGATNVNAYPTMNPNRLVVPTTTTGNNAMALFNSSTAMPLVNIGDVTQLPGENTFLIRNMAYIPSYTHLRVIVQNNDDLSNLSPRTQIKFAELCILAVKSDIYNELIVTIDEQQIMAGRGVGAFKNMLESYNDAETMYQEALAKFTSTMASGDREQQRAMIRLSLGARY